MKTRIHYDHRYERPNTSLDEKFVIYKTRFVMRNTYDIQIKSINSLQLYSFYRGELKLITYNRRRLIDFFRIFYIDISLLIFMNAFELYRNMYKSILGVYLIIAKLN